MSDEEKVMSIRLPLDLARALEAAAKLDDLTQAQLIRRALRSDLSGHSSATVRKLAQR